MCFEQTGGMASTPSVAFWCKPCAVRPRDGGKCPHHLPQTTMQSPWQMQNFGLMNLIQFNQ